MNMLLKKAAHQEILFPVKKNIGIVRIFPAMPFCFAANLRSGFNGSRKERM